MLLDVKRGRGAELEAEAQLLRCNLHTSVARRGRRWGRLEEGQQARF